MASADRQLEIKLNLNYEKKKMYAKLAAEK